MFTFRPHPEINWQRAPEHFYSKQIYCKGDVWQFGLLLLQTSLSQEEESLIDEQLHSDTESYDNWINEKKLLYLIKPYRSSQGSSQIKTI